VRAGAFPEESHTYSIPEEELSLFEAGLGTNPGSITG
jgi:hypothetical protein